MSMQQPWWQLWICKQASSSPWIGCHGPCLLLDAEHGCCCGRRYRKAADWQLVAEIAATARVPIIGNGDVLTYYEAHRRQEQSAVHAMMVGRGALIKPWIFQEIKEVSQPWAVGGDHN
jgi:hypothetical protein